MTGRQRPGSAAACAFCSVVAGETNAHVVLDTPDVVAFLDRRPLFEGHCLVVPRAHHETFLDLPDDAVGPLFAHVRCLAAAVMEAVGAAGTFVAMNNRVSQSVPHLHVMWYRATLATVCVVSSGRGAAIPTTARLRRSQSASARRCGGAGDDESGCGPEQDTQPEQHDDE